MSKLVASEALLQKWVTVLSVSLFVCGVLFYTLQVVLRIFFKSTLYWIDPTIGYLFAISALWGAALACQHNENIKIELFKKWKRYKLAALTVDGFSLLITILMLYIFYLHFSSMSALAGHFFALESLKDIPYILIFLSSLLFYTFRIIRILHHPTAILAPPSEEMPSSTP